MQVKLSRLPNIYFTEAVTRNVLEKRLFLKIL